MQDSESNGRGATVAQLKSDIDLGRTADKVSFPDPGLAPLGTDDEAAGTPASPELVSQVRREERAIGRSAAAATEASAQARRRWLVPSLLIGTALVILAGALMVLWR